MRPPVFVLFAAVVVVILLVATREGRTASGMPALATVPQVDLARYMGLWYEIARIDHWFQKGCINSSATYTMLPDGDVEVINRCVDGKDGRIREVKGRAWSVDPVGNSRLKVSFFRPFRGDYWIVELGRDYEYAVVGAPNRRYLWILARQPVMDESVYNGILERLRIQGFAVEQLMR